METQIKLGVFRRFDDREGQEDGFKYSLELHNIRKNALHEVFDTTKDQVSVSDWGQTDDTQSHELVELVLGVVGSAAFQYVVVPGIQFLANKLAEKLIDEASSELAKWIVSKLHTKQKSKEIFDYFFTLKDGTIITVDPPDTAAKITIQFKNGETESFNYGK
jgi:hypothetical protein